ncbi:MAG: acyl-CoA/acyl-ACP dehydrogenase [Gammaproteobacteria bacterium]|nr:acyl-CoA/acyl-ACP dehydrogenase [Gammaproteobacteria bacterium]
MKDFFDDATVLTPDQMEMRESLQKLCANYNDDYWLERDQTGQFPEDFVSELAEHGWLGINTPLEYGGSGLGITEGAVLTLTIGESGGGITALSSTAHPIFGLNPVIKYGRPEQIERMVPRVIQRKEITCFGVTEPNTGLDTTKLKTKATKKGKHYIVDGQKIWTSTAQHATKILLIARTTPIENTRRPVDGLSLFYTDFDRNYIEVREIEKMGRKASDSNQVFFDGLPIPEDDLIGNEGKGFYYLLDGLNPERILAAAGSVGLGRAAIRKAVQYARDRVVFDRPIGKNQGIQHPLAECWAELEAANLMAFKAANLYDQGHDVGHLANAAKYLAAEASFKACTQAVMTHGGMGYAKEFHVERYLRESLIPRIAPVSPQLILCHIAERVLGLPKSY